MRDLNALELANRIHYPPPSNPLPDSGVLVSSKKKYIPYARRRSVISRDHGRIAGLPDEIMDHIWRMFNKQVRETLKRFMIIMNTALYWLRYEGPRKDLPPAIARQYFVNAIKYYWQWELPGRVPSWMMRTRDLRYRRY